jgi:hypothetical protein
MPWPFSKKDSNAPPRSAYFGSSTPLLSYWIYFKERPVAEQAVVRLQALDLTADLQKAASGKKPWLVLAYRPVPDGPESVERESAGVKAVAAALAGEYDGWEAGPLLDEQMADRIQSWFNQGIGQP